MPEYIEREAVLTAILNVTDGNWKQERYANEIKAIHSADVEPVRHGRWEYDHWCEFKCSECGCLSIKKQHGQKYCHNCGAKMDMKS